MKIALTGASGFLGRHIREAAAERGDSVTAIPLKGKLHPPYAESLQRLIAPARDCDVLINCAAALRVKEPVDDFVNTEMPGILAEFMSASGTKMVHLSSANVLIADLQDRYSNSKRDAEAKLEGAEVAIIRPGLIWSWTGNGNSEIIRRYLSLRLPFHPMFSPGNIYQPVGPEGAAAVICDLAGKAANGDVPRSVTLVGDTSMTFFDLCNAMANTMGKRLIPLPTVLVRAPFFGTASKFFRKSTSFQQFLNIDRRLAPSANSGDVIVLPFGLPFAKLCHMSVAP